MTTSRQKRIEELEAELKLKQRALEEQMQINQVLVTSLQEIAGDRVPPSYGSLKAYAKQALVVSKAEAQMQQRDLNIAYLTLKRLKFPVELRKMWSGGEVQNWIDQYAEVLKQRALAHQEDKLDKKETLQ